MQAHHYLGSLAKIGETLWYVATFLGEWVALLSFSSAALKCAARDRWIGWNFRHQYSRLNLLTNNSRFLILPAWHYPNLASKTLSLCLKRLSGDWQTYFGHPLLLVETFVDPARFHGTLYKASNWLYLGNTQGFSRTRQGYSATATAPKMLFVVLLQADARSRAFTSHTRIPLPNRNAKTHVIRRKNALALRFLYRHSRPPPRSGTPSFVAHGTGHRRCGGIMRQGGL